MESKEMKKAHRLMIPLLVVISISALLGASVFAAKPDHHPLLPDKCDCFTGELEGGCQQHFDPLCCDPPHAFKPDHKPDGNCAYGYCLGAHLGTRRGNRPDPE